MGYTESQIRMIMAGRIREFERWMYGQTMSLCEEHGTIVYPWDVDRFIKGLPVID